MKLRLLTILLLTVTALPLAAQRRVTPVTPQRTELPSKAKEDETLRRKPADTRPRSVVEHTDDSGRTFLLDTITGSEWVDSVALAQPKAIGNIYPLLHSVTIGADVSTPFMRTLSQHYGITGFSAGVSLHNRYIPTVEVGLGQADNTPANGNFTYRSPLSVYFKLGADYNFLYNSNPDYCVLASLRYGLSPFAYSVDDVHVTDGYWGTSESFSIPSQHCTVGFLEFGFGLKVKIAGSVSAGWRVNYHKILHESKSEHGRPWYIPGYGTRSSALTAALYIYYTLNL